VSGGDVVAAEVEALIAGLKHRFGHDFSGYGRASLHRRFQAALDRAPEPTLSALQGALLRDPDRLGPFLDAVSVPRTEMFRHPPTWRLLREQVIPRLATYPRPEVWVAGCATGQEVWSVAILLEEAGILDRCRIHATDLAPGSLRAAAEGIVEASELRTYTDNYQRAGGESAFSEYFSAAYGFARFRPELLRTVEFQAHSLATDGPFASVHLVLCRNVLIYFDPPLQSRAIGVLAASLVRRGYLCLGSQESLRFTGHASAFEPLQDPLRVYRAC